MLLTRALGTSGLVISPIGLGAWAIGGDGAFGWGPQDDQDSIATIHRAVECGINWIDTAAVYGDGHSEEVVGKAVAALPECDRPLVFTKGGVLMINGQPQDISNPASLRFELEASLRRLQTETVDLYQVHWPTTDGTALDVVWDAMLTFRNEGKARAVGVSNYSIDQLEQCLRVGPVASVQPRLSLIHRQSAADVIPWAKTNGAGVIVYSPLGSGLLSGSFSHARARALPATDWRSGHRDFTGDALERNLALVERLRPIARERGTTVGAVAVAWALSWPGVTGAILGARRPEQIDGWIDSATVELSATELAQVAVALDETGAGDGGPTTP